MLTTGLQGRLFAWTFLFVMVAEVVVFVPSLGMFYKNWLGERISAAQIGALALEATRSRSDLGMLHEDILSRSGVSMVILRRGDTREPLFMAEDLPAPDIFIDLGERAPIAGIRRAFGSLIAPAGRTVHVLGPKLETGEAIEIMFPEAPLTADLVAYCHNIFMLSLLIALITAGCVYLTVYLELVRPIRLIIGSMLAFRQHPEDASRVAPLPMRRGELADAASTLHAMQTDLRAALQQKSRLAALGTAVSKINHDLRNILASAQLIADRLSSSTDPTVQRIAPQLVRSIDRAVTLCTDTLRYGRAQDPAPVLQWVPLAPLCEDVRSGLGLQPDRGPTWAADIPPGLQIHCDPDHLFRTMLNLARNAKQAIEAEADRKGRGRIALRARHAPPKDGASGALMIEIEDDGPGIPEKVRDQLFQAFVTSARAGGTGLGLAIARDLTLAQGGRLSLIRSSRHGTVFRIELPQPRADRPAPARHVQPVA
ncbi:MAG: ATP-binding protein [Alphaproteobacteria bacterium]